MTRSRPSMEWIWMCTAQLMADRSTCQRLSVGCVITSADLRKVLAVGYNGNYVNGPNTCDSDTQGSCGCLHAEENAAIACDAPRHMEKIVFTLYSPCRMCAKRLINLGGVVMVYYTHEFRELGGVEVLQSAGVKVMRVGDG